MSAALSTSQVRTPSKTNTPFRVIQGRGQTYLQYDVMTKRTITSSNSTGQLVFTDRQVPVAINIMPNEQVFPAITEMLKQYYELEASVMGITKERDEALEELQRLKASGLTASRASQTSRKKD